MSNTPGGQVEKAFAALITALGISGLNVYTGLDNREVTTPAAVISALTSYEDFIGGGVWHVPTRITVYQIASDTDRDDADDVSGQVFEACATAAPSALTALSGFAVFDLQPMPGEQGEQGDAWSQSYNLEVIGALS